MLKWDILALSVFVSLGGLNLGLDTGLIGPVTVMPQFLYIFPEAKDKAIQGTLLATIIMSAAVSSAFSSAIADRLSRKRTIGLGAIICGLGCALEAGAMTFPMLIIGRLIAGVGEGWFLSTIAVYLVEISPPTVRGKTACMLQTLITIGIVIGYFTCYVTVSLPSSFSWRIPFMLQALTCFILAAGTPFIPYSPRWLLHAGREEEAWEVIAMFDREGAELQKEKILERISQDAAAKEKPDDGFVVQRKGNESLDTLASGQDIRPLVQSFETKSWGRTVFAMTMLSLQQFSGIDGVLCYAPVLFTQAGFGDQKASFLASGVSGIINCLATIPVQFWLVDKWGRRPSSIAGGFIMGICMTTIGVLYASDVSKTDAGRWTIIVMIYSFIAAFASTWGIVLKILTTEMQPLKTRALASSLAQTSSWVSNLIVIVVTPVFLNKSASGSYFMFGGFLFFGTILCIMYAPETLGKSLDDVDAVWEERVRKTKAVFNRSAPGISGGQSHLRRGAGNFIGLHVVD